MQRLLGGREQFVAVPVAPVHIRAAQA